MKLSFILLLIAFTFISSNNMIEKLIKVEKYASKKTGLKIIGELLLYDDFEPAFVAGILANVFHDKKIGYLEKSDFSPNPENEPEYLKIMDEKYNYRTKYSGKLVTDIPFQDLRNLVDKLNKKKWKEGKFGLGSLQWRGKRTYTLTNLYNSECGSCTKITEEEATSAEGKMIISELRGKTYEHIYKQWKERNTNLNSPQAASDAGKQIAKEYEIEFNLGENEIKTRGKTAHNMYNVMTSS